MSVAMQVDMPGYDRVRRALDRLAYGDTRKLLDTLGQLIENQIKYRILHEKKSPDGEDWEELSLAYEDWKTSVKGSGVGLLELEGDLVQSIQHIVGNDQVEIGSNLDYAATHQFGYVSDSAFASFLGSSKSANYGAGVPARPYIGLSRQNEDDIEATTVAWLRKVMGVLV